MPALENEAWEAFCQEYVKDFNTTAAMFKVRKYKNENAAGAAGCRLLRNAKVSARVKELMAVRTDRIHVEIDNIVMELAILAFSDIRNICSWNDGGLNLKSSDELSPAVSKAIKEVTYHFSDGKGRVQVKMHDKFPALEKLGKHLGMFAEKEKDPATINNDKDELANRLISQLSTVLKDDSCQTSHSQSSSQSSPAQSSLGLLGATKGDE